MKTLLIYFREIIASLPLALIKSWKTFGWRGSLLASFDYILTFIPVPISLPGIGTITIRAEARSMLDNFCLGELRCAPIEAEIISEKSPRIIDLGVNIGMSIRWWLSLNKDARVVGIDMMNEALEFTKSRVKLIHPECSWKPICCAVSRSDEPDIEIHFDNPLEGTTSLQSSHGSKSRIVPVRCLDSLFMDDEEVLLLKCDIEGYGGHALAGGEKLLQRTRYVVTETHGATETEEMSKILSRAGFVIFNLSSRSLWWRKAN